MLKISKTGTSTVGFCDQFVTINSYGSEADKLIDFLCCDLQQSIDHPARAAYDLMVAGREPTFSLWFEEKKIYFGSNRYDLAYTLINEILHHCIVDNDKGHVIHSAAIGSDDYGILLPGKSGSGKSTFATWLVSNGCNYLTDELVVLTDKDRRIIPFTRPFSIKSGSTQVLSSFLDIDPGEVISGSSGFMMPHRQVNSKFCANTPPLSLILFPEYNANADPKLTKLSPALGCARLMECYVNARNIQGHGIGHLAELTRVTPVYKLTYGSFEGLQNLLSTSFPLLF